LGVIAESNLAIFFERKQDVPLSMKKLFVALIAVLAMAAICRAEKIIRGPYLQLLTSESVVIRWRTDKPSASLVQFWAQGGQYRDKATERKKTTEHVVTVKRLTPKTKYFYAIGLDNGRSFKRSSQYFFITAPPIGTAQPIRFWVLGDPGTRNTNQIAVRDAYYKFTVGKHTDGWLTLGDNAYSSGTDKEYQGSIFAVYSNMLAHSCLWPTLGNHDARSANSDRQSGVYYDIFTLPKHGEAGGYPSGTEAYYSFDYGNAHFVCLNSSDVDRSPKSPMLKWLRKDLAANKQTWCVAYFHHPPYTKGSHDSDKDHLKPNDSESGKRLKEMRENVLPILEDGGVDLVLGGHSHDYERSWLMDGHYGFSDTFGAAHKKNSGSGRLDRSGPYMKPTIGPGPHEGTVYIVAGSSGKITGGKLDHPAMLISRNELGSLVLDFNTNRLDVTFLGVTEQKIDHFTIMKGTDP
jgi:acid phosphatase type 7